MLSALNIVKNITGNSLLSEIIQSAAKEVERGHDLGAVLASRRTFPGLATQMIQVGEQSGKLEVMLNKIADVYENEAETSIVGMTSLLEPLIILVMGVIVGFIVLSICLPIFEMNQLVR
jgi:general secretion pathway protein F